MRSLAVLLPLLFLSPVIPGYASSLAPSTPELPPPAEIPTPHPAMCLSLPIKNANEVTFNMGVSIDYSSFDAGLGGVVTGGVVNVSEGGSKELSVGETVHVTQDLGYVGFKTSASLVHATNGGFSLDYRYLLGKNTPTTGSWQDVAATAGYCPDPYFFDTVAVQSFSANWNLESGHDFDARILLPNLSGNARLTFNPFISLFASYYDQSFRSEYLESGGAEPLAHLVSHRQHSEALGPGLGINMFYSLLTKPRQVMGFRASFAYNPLSVHYNIHRSHAKYHPKEQRATVPSANNTDNCTKTKACLRSLVEFGYAHTPPMENTYTYTAVGFDTALYLGFQEAFGTAFGIYCPRNFIRNSVSITFTAGF